MRGYILETHKEANDTIKKDISVFSEKTCCFQEIQKPLDFWKNKNIVKLPPKNVPRGSINSHSGFKFQLRREQIFDFNVSKDEYYKLFLKICYTGIRLGLPHEFGYNHICPYCGFKNVDNSEEAGVANLEQQKVEINENTFQNLLDAVHKANIQKPNEKIIINSGNELFKILYDIQPVPYDRWRELLNMTFQELLKLPKDASEENYANAYGELSSYALDSIEEIGGFLNEEEKKTLIQILDQPLLQVIESIQTSILLPLSRIINGYNISGLFVPKSYNLDGFIIVDIDKFIKLHVSYLQNLIEKVTGFAKEKISYSVSQLSIFLSTFQKNVRAPLLLGGKIGIPYLLKAGIVSILRDMCDPNITVPNSEGVDNTSRIPQMVLKELLYKYRSERFRLTDENIRIEIAKRDEKEKMLIISKFDRMTKEEKTLELMKKRLGIGDWAVGGTKVIYAYNPEQYERDREQRIQMGFSDFPIGQEMAENRFYEENGGYDFEQVAEDEY